MSLTSILTNPLYIDFKKVLKENTLKPQFLIKAPIKAPPLTNNYSIVGQAFDYLLRFYIEQDNIMAISDDEFLAEIAYYELDKILEKSNDEFIRIGYKGRHIVDKDEFHLKFCRKFLRSYQSHWSYCESSRISDALLKACLFFARLDLFMRKGHIDTGLVNEESVKDVEDLKNLFKVYKKSSFHSDYDCVLNPTFGKGSSLVGGADADLIVDDMLVEIKTSIHPSLKRKDFDQVFCYYILSLIGRIRPKCYIKRINRIGIYYSRYGILWQTKISEIASKDQINYIKNYMTARFSIK